MVNDPLVMNGPLAMNGPFSEGSDTAFLWHKEWKHVLLYAWIWCQILRALFSTHNIIYITRLSVNFKTLLLTEITWEKISWENWDLLFFLLAEIGKHVHGVSKEKKKTLFFHAWSHLEFTGLHCDSTFLYHTKQNIYS